MAQASGSRAFRGLATVFVLSFVSLIGVIVTATALGALEPWTRWQFIGLFGVLEVAAGVANVIAPNLWRLPVAELNTKVQVTLAPSTALMPHWGGLARAAAGLVLVLLVALQEGVEPATLALVPLIAAVAVSYIAASAVVARIGVSRPDLDVIQLVVRWAGRGKGLTPISIGASVLQFLLAIATIPIAEIFPTSILYQPELAPSREALLACVVASAVLAGFAYAVWAGRFARTAPPEQRREADERA
jgi:hypothetical protein